VSFHAAASKPPYHIAHRNGIAMLAIGALTAFLALGIFAFDHNNEFLIILFPLALVLLGIGLVMD
jgi:hypothetical protein